MSARALIEAGESLDIFALVDEDSTELSGRWSTAMGGRRGKFVTSIHAAAFTHTQFLYDAVGPARAHPRIWGLRRPYGVWMHGVEVWDNLTLDRAVALRRANFVLVNSQFTLERFEQRHWPLKNAQVCHLATEQNDAPIRSTRMEGAPTALLIGRCDKANFRKGHAEVIAAWEDVVKVIPNAELMLVGGGDGLDMLRAAVGKSAAQEQIKVLGFVPERYMPEIWAKADVFVQPSWKEGFGLVYIEAMRHSLPVIASVHDAGSEINCDGITGFNVSLDDPAELVNRLVLLLRNKDLAKRMGLAGYCRWRERFRYSAFRDRFLSILKSLDVVR